MKDQILESYVDDFSDAEDFKELSLADRFERFVNYCVVSKQYPREFDIESLSVGGGDDIGVDGMAITVNGNIVQSEEEIEYLLQKNGYIDASFTFIQSKSSSKFKGDQVGTLIFGIKSFFDAKAAIPENEDIKNLRSLKDKIYKHSINFDEPPELRIYFVTTGEWKEPEQITGRVERELADIKSKRMFRGTTFSFYDANRLKETYRELRRKTIKEVDFPNHVALPEISGVRQSFVGSLAAKEYVRLISDSDGNLHGLPNVKPTQVVTLAAQINAYVATTLAQPHSTHRYYGELLEANRNKIFRSEDNKEPYYLSSLMLNRLDRTFKSGKIPKSLKKFRYQILHMAHSYNEVMRKNKNGYSFSDVLELYENDDGCLPVFQACATLVQSALRSTTINSKEAIRSRDFSNELRSAFEAELKAHDIT